jgi:hypothetical protein
MTSEDRLYPTESPSLSSPPVYSSPEPPPLDERGQRRMVAALVFAVIVVASFVAGGVYFLFLPSTNTARIRDVFIIFMAIQSLLIGFALIILMIQVVRLTNLLENEIKPILNTTNETVSHLRGTTVFLSQNLTEPVIKLNQYLAGLSQMLESLGFVRRRK